MERNAKVNDLEELVEGMEQKSVKLRENLRDPTPPPSTLPTMHLFCHVYSRQIRERRIQDCVFIIQVICTG